MNGLRAIAALFVVIYHLNQHLPTDNFGYFSIGIHQFIEHFSIMVSVFFMLSGFFRSLSYWKSINTPTSIQKFSEWLRDRFFRIAPAYYVMLIVSLIATYCISWIPGINFPAFFTGFSFLTWISPNTLFPVLLNGPLWFIPLDMMWWIMTSLFMIGIMKIKKIYYIPYFLIAWGWVLGLNFLWTWLPWTPSEGISSIWFPIYNPFLFFLHFLFGIIAAGIVTWLRERNQQSNIWFDIGCIITTIVWVIILWNIRGQNDWALSIPRWPYHFPIIPTLIAIIMVCLPFSRYIGRILDNTFLIFTAKISYSLFLTHALIIALLYEFYPPENTILLWVIYSGVTLILSYMSAWLLYRYIEVPCIPIKKINTK